MTMLPPKNRRLGTLRIRTLAALLALPLLSLGQLCAQSASDAPPARFTPPFNAAAAGLTRLFNGNDLTGWVGNPAAWKVVDGAIVGTDGNQALMSSGDFDNFRLIVSTVQVQAPENHQGICFWGNRPSQGEWGYGGSVVVMPPMPWTWDYTTKAGLAGRFDLSRDLNKETGLRRSQWTQAEILVDRSKGTILMAVNGVEVLSYIDPNPARFKAGPIGLQAHSGNHEVRYKDIFIEVSPRENRLITAPGRKPQP